MMMMMTRSDAVTHLVWGGGLMCEGGEGPTDHIPPPQQVYFRAKVHQKAAAAQAARPGTQAGKGAGP